MTVTQANKSKNISKMMPQLVYAHRIDGVELSSASGMQKEDELHPGEVNLGGISLTIFPSEAFSVKNLRTTSSARRNTMEYLPNNIDLLEYLEILNVANNALTSLPATMGNLRRLRKLQNNRLQWLSAEMCARH